MNNVRYTDQVFGVVDLDHELERLAGGNETEVYRTDDQRHVVKLKSDLGGTLADVLAAARAMRDAAAQFAACLGPRHSIPSSYIIARDSAGRPQVLVVQPFLRDARPLHDIDYAALTEAERASIAEQLREIIRRSLTFYRTTGSMPDLYGRTSSSSDERAKLNAPHMLPWRLWSFLVERNLLRSHNLMLTGGPDRRVVLVDYDIVRRSRLYRRIYYMVRWFLFWRDHGLIVLMRRRRGLRKGMKFYFTARLLARGAGCSSPLPPRRARRVGHGARSRNGSHSPRLQNVNLSPVASCERQPGDAAAKHLTGLSKP